MLSHSRWLRNLDFAPVEHGVVRITGCVEGMEYQWRAVRHHVSTSSCHIFVEIRKFFGGELDTDSDGAILYS